MGIKIDEDRLYHVQFKNGRYQKFILTHFFSNRLKLLREKTSKFVVFVVATSRLDLSVFNSMSAKEVMRQESLLSFMQYWITPNVKGKSRKRMPF